MMHLSFFSPFYWILNVANNVESSSKSNFYIAKLGFIIKWIHFTKLEQFKYLILIRITVFNITIIINSEQPIVNCDY